MTSTDPRRWWGLGFISVAVSLIIVDSTIVNVAVPAIVSDLGISSTEVQWVQEVYTLVFASLLLLFGATADRIGRRRALLTGVALFAGASVAAAFAPIGGLLILARTVQGVGGALILPATLSLLNAGFRGRERAIAFAVWGSTIGGMAAVGPLLGGWLTTAFSWRWAFGVNVPLGILVVVGVLATVRESRETSARIDLVGSALSVVLFGTLVFALIEGRTFGWWTAEDGIELGSVRWTATISPVPIAFAVSAAALVLLLIWSRARARRERPALLDLSLFRVPTFARGNLVALVVALGEFGIILSLPLWLQFAQGFDALQTGLVLLALAIGSFGASGLIGALSARVRPVIVVRAGLLAEIVGIVGVGLAVGSGTGWGWLVPALFVYGFGVGLATAQLTGVILADVPVERSGQASGTQSTARQVGSALGVAILGTVLFTGTGAALSSSLDDAGVDAGARDAVVSRVVDSAGAAISSLEGDEHVLAEEAFTTGTQLSAFTAAGFLAIGFAASFGLGSARREQQPA
ncbi:DHA2 family efflux MFS transporter permease subunit [Microbacterium sp. NPDC055683]